MMYAVFFRDYLTLIDVHSNSYTQDRLRILTFAVAI